MNRPAEIAKLARELALSLVGHSGLDTWCHGCGRAHAEKTHEKTCMILRARHLGLVSNTEAAAMALENDRELRRRAAIANAHK